MKLGKFVEISMSVTDLMKSLTFYERLGFEKRDQSWEPWPWAVMSDGVITMRLSQYSVPSKPLLSYIAEDTYRTISQIRKLGYEMTPFKSREIPEVQGLITPGDIELTLVEHPTDLIPRPSGQSSCYCGRFGELAFPIRNLRESLDFWLTVGFDVIHKSELPFPWAWISDDLMTLGLYQTDHFTEAGLTYYSEDPADRIEYLKNSGFRFQTELPSLAGGLGRAVMETPDKQLLVFMERTPRNLS